MPASPIPLRAGTLDLVAARGVRVPAHAALQPRIVHVGVGGFARAHLALYTDRVAEHGGDWGIVGLGLRPQDAEMAAALAAQDHLYTLVEKGEGEPVAAMVGSLVGFVHAPEPADPAAAELVAAPSTAILSLTITEAGYGEPAEGGPPGTFDRLAAGLLLRRDRGTGPLTILSCDNVPGNGTVARRAMLAAAARLEPGLADWVGEHCTFPTSMVDRITPVTAGADRAWLRDVARVEDRWPVVSEPFRQWVLEDDFAAGRPAWEQDGALFTARVHDWEDHKLRLLNAGHSAIAYPAALAGLTHVDEAIAVPAVRRFLTELLLEEAVPTLARIPDHPPEDYVASVLERFASAGVRDQVARLCVDGTAKLATFLVPTVAAELERDGPVERAATVLAAWARYLVVVPVAEQAADASGDAARAHAERATGDARAFLAFAEVFPPQLRDSPRFADAFAAAYERIVADGPVAALG